MPKLKTCGEGKPVLEEGASNGPEIFAAMSWDGDTWWEDAHLKPLVVYLRGNRSLQMPDRWKQVFPRQF